VDSILKFYHHKIAEGAFSVDIDNEYFIDKDEIPFVSVLVLFPLKTLLRLNLTQILTLILPLQLFSLPLPHYRSLPDPLKA